MLKINLPTIVLKGKILFPEMEIKLELDNEYSKNIISEAEYFHDNTILVSFSINKLEESPSEKDLSNVGIISKIIHKIDLPNGKTRVIIKGISRACIHEYLNFNKDEEILEAILSKVERINNLPNEEIMVKKLYREIEDYIHNVPYISNSFLADITNVINLEVMTDIIAPNLPISYERLLNYVNEFNCEHRFEMILEDIYIEKEKFDIEKNIDLKIKKEIEDSQKKYLIREKIEALRKELDEDYVLDDETASLKNKVEQLNAPNEIKNRLFEEIQKYETKSSSLEAPIVRNYIDYLLKLPWNQKTIDCNDLSEVLKSLNNNQYGMDTAKERIIEYLAVKKVAKNVRSPILCLVGPPGIGKTTLGYNIAQSLERKFVKISLGGVNDPAEIVGHRRTYLGAEPGKIIQGLKKCQSSNPVFLIDEIDKMGKDIKGDPANALLEVLDSIQNKHFSDHYVEEEVDLSEILFIATANNVDEIPSLLKDRLEIIELNGYTEYEKLEICKQNIIPKICKEHELNIQYIDFSDDAIYEIIRSYTKEAGVRELQRQISKIIRKIMKTIVVHQVKVSNIKITPDNLEKYLGPKKLKINYDHPNQVGVVNSLAWTPNGGEVYPIEVSYFEGKGNLILTGNVGKELQESALVSLNYLRANCNKFGLELSELLNHDIHIHIPKDGTKNGSSIGVALTTALFSVFSKQKIPNNMAFTGEITLLGNILPVGNIVEKIEGAIRNNIKIIVVPKQNEQQIKLLPSDLFENIELIYVDHYFEIISKIKQYQE